MKWIQVKEELPAHGQVVGMINCKDDLPVLHLGVFDDDHKVFYLYYGEGHVTLNATHWFPTPEGMIEL